eukprot:scaffold90336_cov63-Attheya_sp.AAC.2
MPLRSVPNGTENIKNIETCTMVDFLSSGSLLKPFAAFALLPVGSYGCHSFALPTQTTKVFSSAAIAQRAVSTPMP